MKTESWAASNSWTTSVRDLTMEASSPTARVMRLARLLRRAWSMLSSHGEPGARNALYRPTTVSIAHLKQKNNSQENNSIEYKK